MKRPLRYGGQFMSRLPIIGQQVHLFGVGCEGCGSFHGTFEVRNVGVIEGVTTLVVRAQDVKCDTRGSVTLIDDLTLEWDVGPECWRTRCGDGEAMINLAGHYQGTGHRAA